MSWELIASSLLADQKNSFRSFPIEREREAYAFNTTSHILVLSILPWRRCSCCFSRCTCNNPVLDNFEDDLRILYLLIIHYSWIKSDIWKANHWAGFLQSVFVHLRVVVAVAESEFDPPFCFHQLMKLLVVLQWSWGNPRLYKLLVIAHHLLISRKSS